MANIFEAEAAGMADGMSHSAPRAVPEQFSAPALADAYLEAYDRMRQSLRGCVPAPPQERLPKIKPPAAEKPAKAKRPTVTKAEPVRTLPPMEAALERLLQSA